MPIYPYAPLSGGEPIVSFKEKGLFGKGPVGVEDSGVFMVPRTISHGLNNLITFIHMFFFCNSLSTATITQKVMFDCIAAVSCPVPVVGPLLYIFGSFSVEQKEDLRGFGMKESPDNRKNSWVGTPSYGNVREMVNTYGIDFNNRSPYGNVSPSGYLAFEYAWKAIAVYMYTVGGRTGDLRDWKYVNPDQEHYGDLVDKTTGLDMGANATKDIVFEEMDDGDMGTTEIYTADSYEIVFEPVGNSYTVPSGEFWIGENEHMQAGGHLFPYFDGLLTPSVDYISSVFFQLFGKCIASSSEQLARRMVQLRYGFRNLSKTKKGLELQHILWGIKMSSEVAGVMRIIIVHGVYRGFLIYGRNNVLDHGVMKAPLSKQELQKEYDDLAVHHKACVEIVAMLEEAYIKSGLQRAIDLEEVKRSARLVHNLCEEVGVAQNEALRISLEPLIRKLRYGLAYWEANSTNLIRVVEAMTTGNWKYPEAPYCLDAELWYTNNRLLVSLAVFGPKAPSIVAASQTFHIARPGTNDSNLVRKDGKRHLQYIPFYIKSIQQAAIDWNKVRDKKVLSMYPPQKKSKAFTERNKADGFIDQEFDHGYEMIRLFAYAFEDIDSNKKAKEKSGKRDGPVAGGEVAQSQKKARFDL